MGFWSERQRRFMWANHPGIAKRWAHGGGRGPYYRGGKVGPKKSRSKRGRSRGRRRRR